MIYSVYHSVFVKSYRKIKTFSLYGPFGLTVYSIVIYFYKYRKYRTIKNVKEGFKDHRLAIEKKSTQNNVILSRILDSFNRAKADQENIKEPYKIGQLWQSFINSTFEEFLTAIQNNDTVKLQTLLENFHREKFTINMGGSVDYYAMKKNPLYKYQFVNTWYKYYNIYKEIAGNQTKLVYPQVGNPFGLFYNGQIIPIEAIRYKYYATEILSLLGDVNNPVICEIGTGTGGQVFQIMSNTDRDITYISLDIPEVVVLASFFLMRALPWKKFLLYGEDSLDTNKLRKYDIILMPNFTSPKLGKESIDLFYNSCSFSEMDRGSVEEYISNIERQCRKYFFHINHTAKFKWSINGKEINNIPADQIKLDNNQFKKIYQHPRLFSRLEDEVFYSRYNARHFAFLYERI